MAKARNANQMAQFKFGVIAPLVQKTFPDATAAAYCRRVAANALKLPDGTERLYSPNTLKGWAALYEAGGLEALIRPPRKDSGSARALTPEAAARACALKAQFPKLPATQVRLKLLEENLITAKVSARCLQRFFKDWAAKNRQTDGKDRKAFEAEYFGALWQADSSYMPFLPDENGKKRRTYLIMVLDDYSRLIVGAKVFFTDTAVNFQAVLKSAVATYGVPHKLAVDNGAPYICNQTSFICADIGTQIRRAPPKDAKYKGKIERAFKSIKELWLYGLDLSRVDSLDDFNRLLTAHVRKYNLAIHSSTGSAPMDRFLATRGRIKSAPSNDWLDEKFTHRLTRRVAGDSTLQLDGRQWDAPMQFIGYNVEVRYLPGREAYILAGGERISLRLTNKQENSRARRMNTPSIDYSMTGGNGDV